MRKERYKNGVKIVIFTCNVCGKQIFKKDQREAVQTDINIHVCKRCKLDLLVQEQENIKCQ